MFVLDSELKGPFKEPCKSLGLDDLSWDECLALQQVATTGATDVWKTIAYNLGGGTKGKTLKNANGAYHKHCQYYNHAYQIMSVDEQDNIYSGRFCKEKGGGSLALNFNGCKICPAGQYQDLLQQSKCKPCLGSTAIEAAHCTPQECEAGLFLQARTHYGASCGLCPLGQFNGARGAIVCHHCAPGRFGPETGATACVACPSGKFQDKETAQSCKSCARGKYQPSTDQQSCLPCQKGEYQEAVAASSCKSCSVPCPAGRSAGESALMCGGFTPLVCTACEAGRFAQIGATKCEECAIGRYQARREMPSCNPCEAGQHTISARSTACVECPPGQFSALREALRCALCTAGTYQPGTGQISCQICSPCPAGLYRTGCGSSTAGQCQACAMGMYKAGTFEWTTVCKACAAGKFSALNGQSCQLCRRGQFQPDQGQSSCIACPAGQATNNLGQQHCIVCASGRFSRGVGSADCQHCEPCPVGQVRSNCGGGSGGDCSSCQSCPPGHFLDRCSGLYPGICTPCQTCGRGQHRLGCGGRSRGLCTLCTVGRYSLQDGYVTQCKNCESCPAGQQREGCKPQSAGTCIACPAGTYRTGSGGLFCETCQACTSGQYRVGCGADSSGGCTACPAGYFKEIFGAWDRRCSSCAVVRCGAGTQLVGCGGPLAGTCTACAAGTYRLDGSGEQSCHAWDDCGAGQVLQGHSASSAGACTACPAGTYKTAGDAACAKCADLECKAGQYRPDCGGASKGSCQEATCGDTGSQWSDPELVRKSKEKGGNERGCTDCLACPKAQERVSCGGSSPGTCANCIAGRFKDVGDQDDPLSYYNLCLGCRSCEAGYFRAKCEGASSGHCAPCPAGKFKNSGGSFSTQCTACTACAEGMFNSGCGGSNSGICLPCPLGTFKATSGFGNTTCSACQPCPPGLHRDGCSGFSEGQCLACADGFFKPVSGSHSTACTSCAACGSGLVPSGCQSENGTTCTSPPAGQFKNFVGAWNSSALACETCPAGLQRESCGSHNPGTCAACPFGTFKAEPGPGSRWDEKCTPLEACAAGYYRTHTSDTASAPGICTPCSLGTYKTTVGNWDDSCKPCTYCGAKLFSEGCGGSNAGKCEVCPPGRFNNKTSAQWSGTGVNLCAICGQGSSCADGTSIPCAIGRFSDRPGASRCTVCPGGRFGNSSGARSANCTGQCLAGYVCSVGSVSADGARAGIAPPIPTPCGSAAHVCPAGSAAATEVSLGHYSVGPKGANDTAPSTEGTRVGQVLCPPGYFCARGVRKHCQKGYRCPAGSVAPLPCGGVNVFCKEMSKHGVPVATGFYTTASDAGGSQLVTATAASELTRDGQAQCLAGHKCIGGRIIPCIAGTYQSATGQTTCIKCTPGRYGERVMETRKLCSGMCPVNKYCPAGSDRGFDCPASRTVFCPQGSATIRLIPAGYYVNKTGATAEWTARPCEPGFFCPNSTRFPCPGGHFCPATATTPIACGSLRYYCPPGSSSKLSVEPGYYSVGGDVAGTTRDAVNPCGSAAHFCFTGVKRSVRHSYYR
jgi:hypothetical protein